MAVVLTVTAPGPAALAELWARLGGHHAHVDIVGDDISIHVDLTPPQPESVDGQVDQEPDEDPVDARNRPVRYTSAVEDPVASRPLTWEVTQTATRVQRDAETAAPDPEPEEGEAPSLRQQITNLLNAQPDRVFTASVVAEHVEGNAGSVAATLKWLTGHDRIRRVGRGQYQALDRTAVHDARRQAAAAAMYSS